MNINTTFIENGLRWSFVFPDFATFTTAFSNTTVPISDPDMVNFFNLIDMKYKTRFLRWNNEGQVIGNMTPLLIDLFRKYKLYNTYYTKTYNELLNSDTQDRFYGLPGSEDEINNTNIDKYQKAKSRKDFNPSNIEIVKELDKIEDLIEKTVTKCAVWFLPGFIPLPTFYQPLF